MNRPIVGCRPIYVLTCHFLNDIVEDTFNTPKQMPVYLPVSFSIFSCNVCMYSQFCSGSCSNMYLPVNWLRRNYYVIPKITGYLCPNWSDTKLFVWFIPWMTQAAISLFQRMKRCLYSILQFGVIWWWLKIPNQLSIMFGLPPWKLQFNMDKTTWSLISQFRFPSDLDHDWFIYRCFPEKETFCDSEKETILLMHSYHFVSDFAISVSFWPRSLLVHIQMFSRERTFCDSEKETILHLHSYLDNYLKMSLSLASNVGNSSQQIHIYVNCMSIYRALLPQ